MTGPTNHHKSFASSSLTRCPGNFPGGHPSQDCSPTSMLNCGVLKNRLLKKKGALLWYKLSVQSFKPHLRCYNHPHLKHTTSSLCLANRPTCESSGPATHTQYLCPTRWLPIGSPSTGTAHGRGSGLIPFVMPRCLAVTGLTDNGFNDRRLPPEITTHAAWKTSQEVTHPKIAPQQARLTVEFLRVGFLKRKVHLLVI